MRGPISAGPDSSGLARYASIYPRQQRQSAFAQLVSRHVDWVYTSARRQVGDPGLAEDMTQAVFILLWRKAESLGERVSVAGWLFRATRYTARDAVKLRRRRAIHEQKAAATESANSTDEAELWPELAPVVDAAIAALGPANREAVVLRYLRQLSVDELAESLSISQAAARKRVARAMDRLRRILTSRGVVTPAGTLSSLMLAHATVPAPAALAAAAVLPAGASAGVQALATSAAPRMIKTKAVMTVLTLLLVAVVGISIFMIMGAEKAAPAAEAPLPPPPATEPPPLPSPQQIRASMARSRTIQLTYSDVGEELRIWFDVEHGMAMALDDPPVWTINNGTYTWQFVEGQNVAGRSRSHTPPSYMRDGLIDWMTLLIQDLDGERLDSADQVIDGVACTAYRFTPPTPEMGEAVLAWFDPQHRLIQAAQVDSDEPMFRFTYDRPIPAERFDVNRLDGRRVIDTDAWLADTFPLDKAVLTRDVLGSHLSVHDLRQGEDGEIFFALVTRLSEQTQRDAPPFADTAYWPDALCRRGSSRLPAG